MKVTEDKPIDHTGPTIQYVSFLEDDKIPSKFPPMRIASIPPLDGIPITTQMFSNIHQNQSVFPSEINLSLSLSYIISTNTFTQADTLHITYSITLLLLRSWERRRLTNWSQDKKNKTKQNPNPCLTSKERHNSGLGKFLNTVILTCLHDSKEMESL